MHIKFISVGGTIDKIYFDAKDTYAVGDPQVIDILREAHVTFDYDVTALLRKDSLDMTDADRQLIRSTVENDTGRYFIITHGTDTMVQTARVLQGLTGKTVVLTGSLTPARFKISDADFNLGMAIAAVQAMPEGVYITMNGRIFTPDNVKKNVKLNRFEYIE